MSLWVRPPSLYIDHNALRRIVSTNLPFSPSRDLCTVGFLIVNISLIHKVLAQSLTERVKQGHYFISTIMFTNDNLMTSTIGSVVLSSTDIKVRSDTEINMI